MVGFGFLLPQSLVISYLLLLILPFLSSKNYFLVGATTLAEVLNQEFIRVKQFSYSNFFYFSKKETMRCLKFNEMYKNV